MVRPLGRAKDEKKYAKAARSSERWYAREAKTVIEMDEEQYEALRETCGIARSPQRTR